MLPCIWLVIFSCYCPCLWLISLMTLWFGSFSLENTSWGSLSEFVSTFLTSDLGHLGPLFHQSLNVSLSRFSFWSPHDLRGLSFSPPLGFFCSLLPWLFWVPWLHWFILKFWCWAPAANCWTQCLCCSALDFLLASSLWLPPLCSHPQLVLPLFSWVCFLAWPS